jgi:hypothetical protein
MSCTRSTYGTDEECIVDFGQSLIGGDLEISAQRRFSLTGMHSVHIDTFPCIYTDTFFDEPTFT